MKLFKALPKFILTFAAIATIAMTVLTPVAKAQGQGGTWYDPDFQEFTDRVFDPSNEQEIFGERYTYAQVLWIVHSIIAIFMPPGLLECWQSREDLTKFQGCMSNLIPGYGYVPPQDSALASTIDHYMLSSPLSGVGYVREKLAKLHLVPEAKAQGFGFQTLSPIRTVWSSVRDISYALLIIAFVIMAFMVMFRMKTSPQTVITVQSAIPKLIMILLLITFSYAIAGFLIDLAYLAVGLFALAASGLSSLTSVDLFNRMLEGGNALVALSIAMLLVAMVLLFTASIYSGGLLSVIALIVGILLFIIFVVVFFIIMFRFLVALFRAFVNIVLLVIVAPLFILMGVFPAGGGFSAWIRSMISNLLVFPMAIVLIFLAHFFFWGFFSANLPGLAGAVLDAILHVVDLNPYGIQTGLAGGGNLSLPGFNFGTNTTFVGLVMAFVIFSLVPHVANIVGSFFSGRAFGFGTAIGQTLAPGGAMSGWTGRQGLTAGERAILGGAGEASANRIRAGEQRWYDPFLAGIAVRRGHLEVPSDARVRRRGAVPGPEQGRGRGPQPGG